MGDKPPKNQETLRALVYLTNIGFTMAATVMVGVLLGRFLDRILGTEPWLLLSFSLLGVVAALKVVFNISKEKFKEISRDNDKDNKHDDEEE